MQQQRRSSSGINAAWLIWPAIAGLAVLFLSEHRQHALDYLPFLILLACPLMHLMHRGHAHRHHGSGRSKTEPQ